MIHALTVKAQRSGGKAKRKPPGLQAGLPAENRLLRYALAILLALAIAVAYSNSLNGPFIFDDENNIVENPSIRMLWPPWNAFRAPMGLGIAGRPLVNFTFALNYAISGFEVWSYHTLNIMIHVMAALILFGIVRRTLTFGSQREYYGRAALPLAFGCALVWGLHPLQTQAVTYIIQRCESLAGLFYLLTLYCSLRGWHASGARERRNWHMAAVASCFLGAGTKEIIVTAPFLVFAYDLVFVHRNPGAALNHSRGLYAGLGLCLLLLGFLVVSVGVGSSGRQALANTSLQYAVSQPQVILHYIRLSLWPDALALDYGWPVSHLQEALPYIVAVLALGLVTAWALWRRFSAGYAAAWFFAILAPTSSFLPIQDLAFEHRMYLPLAGLAALMVIGLYTGTHRGLKSCAPRTVKLKKLLDISGLGLLLVAALSLGTTTYVRNQDYATALAIWSDTIVKRPENYRAHTNLGALLLLEGRQKEAVLHLREALRIKPDYAEAHNNLGYLFFSQGERKEALAHLNEAVNLKPGYPDAHSNLGAVFLSIGQPEEAFEHLTIALGLDPNNAKANNNMGSVLLKLGRPYEALAYFRASLRGRPENPIAHNNLGTLLCRLGRFDEAAFHFGEALRIDPGYSMARKNLEVLRNKQSHELDYDY